MRFLRALGATIKIEFLNNMVYRTNFLIKLLALGLFAVIAPIASFLVYSVSDGLPGWSWHQLLILQGANMLTIGITEFLFGALIWNLLWEIRDGYFDISLVRPASPLAYESAVAVNLNRIAIIFVGAAAVIYGVVKSSVIITPFGFLAFALLIALGVLFIYSIYVLVGAVALVAIKSEGLYHLINEFYSFADYPISIFGPIGIALFTFVLPVGLASFYPAQALLGVLELKSVAALVVVSLAFFGVSLLAWNAGMKKYQSAGG